MDKLCSHCGTTILVGLQYCPGCLRAIDTRRISETEVAPLEASNPSDITEDGRLSPDSMLTDLSATWAGLVYPLKSNLSQLFGKPLPAEPPVVPPYRGRHDSRSGPNAFAAMALSPGYTRVVCPNCLSAQQGSLDLSAADVLTCRACRHQFPASFAAEFRKGADLECFRCGVTTFCVSGLKVTVCPNCRFTSQRATGKTRLKPGVLAAVAALVLLSFFFYAVATKTTPQFVVWLSLTCVGSVVGFVTLVALGI